MSSHKTIGIRFINLCQFVVYFCVTEVTAKTSSKISFSVGNNLVDIAALTTLIGSSTVESLTLGDRGFGGLAWAATSTFGALSVIKGCIAGASASWLRETLGIRNAVSDGTLGMGLMLEKGRGGDERARKGLGEALAISCNSGQVCQISLLHLDCVLTVASRSTPRVHRSPKTFTLLTDPP